MKMMLFLIFLKKGPMGHLQEIIRQNSTQNTLLISVAANFDQFQSFFFFFFTETKSKADYDT